MRRRRYSPLVHPLILKNAALAKRQKNAPVIAAQKNPVNRAVFHRANVDHKRAFPVAHVQVANKREGQ